MQVNWGLLQPVDVGGMFDRGVQQGRQQRIERETDNALRAYAQNPDDPNAVNALLRFNPQMGMQLQQQQADRQRQQQTRAQTAGALGGNMQDLFGLAQSDPEQFARIRPQVEAMSRAIGQVARMSTDQASWDANVRRLAEMYGEGFLRYVGRFDLRDVAIAQSGQLNDWLSQNEPRVFSIPDGGSVVGMDRTGTNVGYIAGGPAGAPAFVPALERTPTAAPQPAAQPPLTDEEGGQILQRSAQSGTISMTDAARMRAAMGPNGNSQFEDWIRRYNIRVIPDAAPAPPPGFVMDN